MRTSSEKCQMQKHEQIFISMRFQMTHQRSQTGALRGALMEGCPRSKDKGTSGVLSSLLVVPPYFLSATSGSKVGVALYTYCLFIVAASSHCHLMHFTTLSSIPQQSSVCSLLGTSASLVVTSKCLTSSVTRSY